jgi:hypothetical protein
MLSGFRIASFLLLPTNASLTEIVQSDLKGAGDNSVVQGKLISHLSTIRTTATSSRPTDSSFTLAFLPSNDSSRSFNNAPVDNYSVDGYSVDGYSVDNYSVNNYSVDNYSVDGYSVNNYSIDNYSVDNFSVDNFSVDNYSVDNFSVDNYSVNNASVYSASVNSASVDNAPVHTASVNNASVSELYVPSIRLSPTLSCLTTSSEVTTPIMVIPPTIIPETHFEQQQSLLYIPTRPVSPGDTSIADHSQNSPRPSPPGAVFLGQTITNAQNDSNANEDQHGPLPEGWETGIDHLGLTYYVNHYTCSITRNRPSQNQAVDDQADGGETNTTGWGSSPSGWEERLRRSPDGRPRLYYVDHSTRSTTWVDPRRQTGGASPQPQTIPQLGPLPSGWEVPPNSTGRVYFHDYNATWDDPQSLSHNEPLYMHDFSQKLTYFRSRPAMRRKPGDCEIKVRRDDLFEDSYAEIMRRTPRGLKRRLIIKFKGRDELEYLAPARFVS